MSKPRGYKYERDETMDNLRTRIRAAVIAKQKRTGSSSFILWRQTGVSKSTICRFLNQTGYLDMDNLKLLAAWAEISLDPEAIRVQGNISALVGIKNALDHDPNLSDIHRSAIYDIMTAGYNALKIDQ